MVTGAQNLVAEGWRHVAVTFDDAANEVVRYVDGSEEETGHLFNETPEPGTMSSLLSGAKDEGGVDEQLQGHIDDLAIRSRVLTEAEIGRVMDVVFWDGFELGNAEAWSDSAP